MTSPLQDAFAQSRYQRSAKYDAEWVAANLMGPNVLWLTEALTEAMDLRPGMRVLDLGCGRAVSSIFLAKEFGVLVWAPDLWIKPTENLERVREAGVEDRVFPIYAEAHALPFAHGFFDAILSMDAFHYFGTDDLYLAYLARFAKPGAQVGVVVPGLVEEFETVPAHLDRYWRPDFWTFHSAEWWRRHWQRSGAVDVDRADMLPEGWRDWLVWTELTADQAKWPNVQDEIDMLAADAGRNLGFVRLVARTEGA